MFRPAKRILELIFILAATTFFTLGFGDVTPVISGGAGARNR